MSVLPKDEVCPECGERPSICVYTRYVSCNICGTTIRAMTKKEVKKLARVIRKYEKDIKKHLEE